MSFTSAEDTKLKIRVASEQHSVDWGTGIASREIRGHSFRIGDEYGYQRAIDDLRSQDFINHCENGVDPAQYLEDQQKELNILRGKIS